MTDGDCQAACLALPDDPGPRLVWADRLDERGDPRGAWLRWLAVELPALCKQAPFMDTMLPDMDALLSRIGRRRSGARLLRLGACACIRLIPLADGRRVWDLLTA